MATQSLRTQNSFPYIWIFFLALIGASFFALWRFGLRGERDAALSPEQSPFNLASAPRPDAPRFPADASRPDSPSAPPGVLNGLVLESRGLSAEEAARQRELAFVQQHEGSIRAGQKHIKKVILKYRRKHPVVRKLNEEVMKMDRVVALSAQYKKDRNFYQWARGVMVLPEVKAAVKKYSADPAMWRAGVGMAVEVLRRPPPGAVYTELVKFFTTDKVVAKPMSEMTTQVLTQLPMNVMQAITPGTNLGPLIGAASELAPGGKLSLPPIPGVPDNVGNMNEYWRGYRDGYEETIAARKGIKTERTR